MASTFCTERPAAKRRSRSSATPPGTSASQPTHVHRGRQDIVDRLCSLGPHKFLSPRLPHAHPSPVYDIVTYPIFPSSFPTIEGGDSPAVPPAEHRGDLLLASFHSEAVNTTRMGRSVVMDHIVTVDQNFVLRLRCDSDASLKREDSLSGMELGRDEEPWPLVVVSHQMMVRDGPMLWQEAVEEVLPWVLDIRAAAVQCD